MEQSVSIFFFDMIKICRPLVKLTKRNRKEFQMNKTEMRRRHYNRPINSDDYWDLVRKSVFQQIRKYKKWIYF